MISEPIYLEPKTITGTVFSKNSADVKSDARTVAVVHYCHVMTKN